MTDRGRAYENRLAKEKGYQKVPFSGAGTFKEDLVGGFELIQAKSTGNDKSYTLLRQDMIDVVRHAAQKGRLGVMYLEWGSQEYVMMRRSDYEAHVAFELVCDTCKTPLDQVACRGCLAGY